VSVNPVIVLQVYPLPTPEEMFSTLANGELFSKLDLARAYKQMQVTESIANPSSLSIHTLGYFNIPDFPLGYPQPQPCGKKRWPRFSMGFQE